MHSSVKTAVFSLVLTLSSVISAEAGCPIGDLNDDCQVDWADLRILANDWLEPSSGGSKADLDGVNGVNMADFGILVGNWRVVGQRIGSLQVSIYPPEAVNGGAKWQVDDCPWRDSGYIETNLPVGFHTVEFNDITGWEKPTNLMVQINDGQTAYLSVIYARPLVISEFLAINNNILEDPCEPGEFPDWIEIYNPTNTTINLGGWYLANWNWGSPDPNLRDWQFPDGIEIDAGEFLVVFASDKNIRDPNAPYLHTSFKLAQNDECVTLVAPDGNTIVHQYAPYPQQLSDTSYGLAQCAEALVPTGATVRYHVPTSPDAGLDWTSPDFNDSGWDTGQTALGFGAAAEEEGNDIGSPSVPGNYSVVNGVYAVEGNGEGIWTGPSTIGDDFYYVYSPLSGNGEISARIVSIEPTNDWAKAGVMIREQITDTSSHAMMIATPPDRGVHIYAFQWVNGADRDNHVPGGNVTLPSWVKIVRDGDDFTGYYAPDEGGEPGSWVQVGTANIPMADDVYIGLCVTSHTDGTLCTAVFDNVQRSGEIGSDLRDQMLSINASVWTRINFYINDPGFYDAITLRVRYEDGYIAYLNGNKVVGKNFTGTPAWNSTAASNRSIEDSYSFESVNLNAFLSLLWPMPEKNVLAIHALNDNASDEDFLMLPELIVSKNEMTPQYFAKPTPGKPNIRGTADQVSEVWFSHERGFYDAPFTLILSTEMTNPGVRIIYTTDGSRPTATNGNIYNPSSPLTIDRTTVIRAVAVRPGWLDSKVQTHTYIFLNDVRYQSLAGEAPGPNWPAPGYFNGQRMDYGMDPDIVIDNPTYAAQIIDTLKAIPTMSLVTDLKNLFDSSIGIYVNAAQEGRAWERPCSLELIYPPNPQGPGFPDLVQMPDANGGYRWDLPTDMRGCFQIDAGMRIRGGYSVVGDNPKHAFRLFFRSEYGQAKLSYPLFGDEGDDVYDHIDLRCSQNYSWALEGNPQNTDVRDVFSRDVQGAAGHPYTRSRYYHLYINGQYWGLFQTQERSEASFAKSYMGGNKEDYDVVNSKWSVDRRIVPTDGDRQSYNRLYDETVAGFGSFERYYRVQGLNIDGTPNPGYERLLDVDNLIDFMIIEYYTGDSDGPGSRFLDIPNNTWGIYNRVNPDGWKWPHHDNEHTLGAPKSEENMVTPFTTAGANIDYFNPHWLHEQLASSNIDYRMHFADHTNRLFAGLLSLNSARNYVQKRANQIDMAIIAESARWGDSKRQSPLTKAEWLNEINRLLYTTADNRCITPRVNVVLQQFKNVGWFPSIKPPTFTYFAGFLIMNNPNGYGKIYYTLDGNDPRIPAAQSAPGYDVHPNALIYTTYFPLQKTTQVKARVWNNRTWSALTEAIYAIGPVKEKLRITEIMYHPKDTSNPNDPNEEFIELKNIGTAAINLNLVRVTSGIDFTFPDMELAGGQYVVVVKGRAAFDAQYPGFTGLVAGEYSGRLENQGERIRLEDAIGQTILDFDYEDGWRDITDGGGFSLTIIEPTSDPSNWGKKDSWRTSAYEGGSPGADDSGSIPNPGAIVINEVLAHSHGGEADWIELYNTTGSAIDIGGWYLSDNDANLMKYRIADGTTIGGHGYTVFYENTDFNNPGDPGCIIPFALSENGEMVCLASAENGILTGYREIEEFGASETGVSFGRYRKSIGTYNFVPMDHNTPRLPNAYPKVGPIVINEIMYNPPSGNQNEEYIELYNRTFSPVTLYRYDKAEPWKFTDGIEYTFPASPPVTIPAGGYVVVVRNKTVFSARYPTVPSGKILGPYSGLLNNAGESLELSLPGDVDELGERQYIRVERVNYSDGSHHENFEELIPPVDQWPFMADGFGMSLTRINPDLYGNDPNNWTAASPTPGYIGD
jgi:hypothetical protein